MRNGYRERAAECLQLANTAKLPRRRAQLLEIALAWVRLSDQAEKNAHADLSYETPPRPTSVPQPRQQPQQRAKEED